MKDIAAFLISLFGDLKISSRRWSVILIIILIILGFFGFENFTKNYYIKKLDAKVSMLERLNNLSKDDIQKNLDLYPIYKSIQQELLTFDIKPSFFLNITSLQKSNRFEKAISGAFLCILLLPFYFISQVKKAKKVTGTILGGTLIILVFAGLLGLMGSIIPTLKNPWLNYIGFPLLQILIIIFAAVKSSSSEKLKQQVIH